MPTWHLDLAAIGAVIGATTLVLWRWVPLGSRLEQVGELPVASVTCSIVLCLQDPPTWPIIILIVTLAIAPEATGRRAALLIAVSAGLTVMAEPGLSRSIHLWSAAATAFAVWAAPSRVRWLRPGTRPLVVPVLAGSLWACAPDTERLVMVGTATAVVVLLARESRTDHLTPAIALAVWAAAWGFEGRPEDASVVLVVVLVLMGWAVVDEVTRTVRARWESPPPRVHGWTAQALTSALALVAARTVGIGASSAHRAVAATGIIVGGWAIWALLAAVRPVSKDPGKSPIC